ncbi:MAG TPA: hypothetical protein VH482_21785 [Thermomicrobiales bacterium]|jgi:hypothetical protein
MRPDAECRRSKLTGYVEAGVTWVARAGHVAEVRTLLTSVGTATQPQDDPCDDLVWTGEGWVPYFGPKPDECGGEDDCPPDDGTDYTYQDGVIIYLHLDEDWTPWQKFQAKVKVAELNEAGKRGELRVTKNPQRGDTTRKYRKQCKNPEPKCHVDHLVDLQLGGLDVFANMWFLDPAVNTSFGAQVNNQIRCYPDGTPVIGVYLT